MSATYLQFFVKTLTLVNLWPQRSTFKQYYVTLLFTVTTVPIWADLILQFHENTYTFSTINENLVALSALYSVIYVSACFLNQKTEIVALVQNLTIFEKYSRDLLVQTDKSVQFYTKLFMVYGIVGNACYVLLPLLDYERCQLERSAHMVKFGIPCGLVVRFLLPFEYDYSPLAELVALYEILICTLCTTVIIVISMLICGMLIHVTAQLRRLQSLVNGGGAILEFCIEYHIAITDYATRVDKAFGRTMLLHITWTGFIISILGFEIVTSSNVVVAVRFSMHLLGWLGLLFLVCYYGQSLMDQSLGIADTVYSLPWTQNGAAVVLILVRSQKALTLQAGGLKVMSLATFLGVLYSAYSYFTLLLKLN